MLLNLHRFSHCGHQQKKYFNHLTSLLIVLACQFSISAPPQTHLTSYAPSPPVPLNPLGTVAFCYTPFPHHCHLSCMFCHLC
uniref:Uncharacterized protein n=1 Tax=Arundo donax TaxID=35708 RepID=A0A0A9BGY8_ARUDO